MTEWRDSRTSAGKLLWSDLPDSVYSYILLLDDGSYGVRIEGTEYPSQPTAEEAKAVAEAILALGAR